MNQPIEQRLCALAAELDQLLPAGHSCALEIRRYAHPPDIQIGIHGVKSYDDATEFFRSLGIQKRNKQPVVDPNPRTVLDGKLGNIVIRVFCDGLPPSCRLEKFVEKVPKTQTVEVGEFVEVTRQKIVCGNGHDEATQPTEEKEVAA